MTLDDVINLNAKFFNDARGKVVEFNPEKNYIISIDASLSFIQIYMSIPLGNEINIISNNYNMLYLESGREYKLNINNNEYPYLIKLYPISDTESSIDITYLEEVQTLNSSNKYYNLTSIENNATYTINNIKENTFIEILSSFNEESIEILKEKSEYNKLVNRELTLIEYSIQAEDTEKNLEIYINSDDNFQIGVFAGPTKESFFYYSKTIDPKYSNLWVVIIKFK